MKKKQLNRRQRWRIRKMQEAYAQRAGKDRQDGTGPGRQGLVISNFGQQLDIEPLDGDDQGRVLRCYQRSNIDVLVPGDYVIWQPGEPDGVVIAALPRKNILERMSSFGDMRPVAANVDNLIIVIAPVPEPHANLIDRYLVAAEHIGINPVILLNKTDLLDTCNRDRFETLLAMYRGIGYQVLEVSARTGLHVDRLMHALDGKTSVFAGQSGVGKSALVNTLLPGVNTLVGELSHAEAKGKHTTTSARLFHFPGGGDLIDSPGIREFSLEHFDRKTLENGFREFRPHLGHCKFRDCRHQSEPGCRLLQAVKNKLINPERLESYQSICNTLDN